MHNIKCMKQTISCQTFHPFRSLRPQQGVFSICLFLLSIELHKANLVGLEVQYYPYSPGPVPASQALSHPYHHHHHHHLHQQHQQQQQHHPSVVTKLPAPM